MRRSTPPHLMLFLRGAAATSLAFLLAFALVHSSAKAQTTDTPIYTIQGSGITSPLVGNFVTTTGVVTRLINNGYYIQDLVGDGNPATSDGLFIFTSSAPTVAVGQLIRITGRVTEFNTGAASNAITAAQRCSNDYFCRQIDCIPACAGKTMPQGGRRRTPDGIAPPQ